MAEYIEKLRSDLVEQFKEKPAIDAFLEAVGEQLNEVGSFFSDLKNERSLMTAKGKQLEGIGEIVVMSKKEAGELACTGIPQYVLNDEDYRRFLMYKIWKNTNSCTYYDVIKSFRMFWDKPLYYKESLDVPATMLFESSVLSPKDKAEKLLATPYVKAAGVAIKVVAITETEELEYNVSVSGRMGRGYALTVLPELKQGDDFIARLRVASGSENITVTTLPQNDEWGYEE